MVIFFVRALLKIVVTNDTNGTNCLVKSSNILYQDYFQLLTSCNELNCSIIITHYTVSITTTIYLLASLDSPDRERGDSLVSGKCTLARSDHPND